MPAVVRINELKANISGGCDLIELRVITGGTLEGFEVLERTTSLLTFGPFVVEDEDYLVVHFNGNDGTCNPNASADEMMAVDEQPAATYTANFDTAYDWYTTDTGMVATDNVITVENALGTIVDAVLVSDDPTGSAAASSETQAAIVAAAGEWEMVGGGIPTNGFVDGDFNLHAVEDLDAANTIQRIDDTDDNDRDDWSATNLPATWGTSNVGRARCVDIVTDMNVWGEPATGIDLRGYTNSTLHWVGCTLGCTPASFYCTTSATSIQFGTSEATTLRALVDPGDGAGDTIPSSFGDCCSAANPTDVCNAPNMAADADALCQALGWTSGTLVRAETSNFCPEASALAADGSDWSSDWVQSDGYGAEYRCDL